MLLEYKELLESHPMNIATASKQGKPNLAVASDVAVISDNQLLISHNEMMKTVVNITTMGGGICMMTFDKNWQGVRLYGTAEYFSRGKWLNRVKELFANDHTKPKGAILVTVNKLERQS
jgi:predicted pyridoxine 5'-phosphate oxidase superfamily flavin-nucleotide-binding protein